MSSSALKELTRTLLRSALLFAFLLSVASGCADDDRERQVEDPVGGMSPTVNPKQSTALVAVSEFQGDRELSISVFTDGSLRRHSGVGGARSEEVRNIDPSDYESVYKALDSMDYSIKHWTTGPTDIGAKEYQVSWKDNSVRYTDADVPSDVANVIGAVMHSWH